MGIIHSSSYKSPAGKPVVAPVVDVNSQGNEWVRFVDIIWTRVLQVDKTSLKDHKPVFKTAKAIVVRGQTSGEVKYISRDALVVAFEGNKRRVSKLINRKKNYELHVKWSRGHVADPRTGGLTESFYLEATPDPVSGEIIRKVVLSNRPSKASKLRKPVPGS